MTRSVLSFAIFFAVSVAVLGGMHGYLWVRLVRDPGLPEPWRRVATVALVALAFAVPLGMIALRYAPRPLARAVPVVAFTWLGLAFLLFSAVLLLDAVRVAAQGAEWLSAWLRAQPGPPADPERRRFVARIVASTAAIATSGAAAYAFRSATGPAQVTEVPVRLERLPRALSGFTIAQITDLHVGPSIGERYVERVVDQVNALKPDVVAVTGDLVDGSVAQLGRAVAHVARLRARHGVFFVTGNHEYYSGVREWMPELRRLGMRVLVNERVSIGDAGASFDLAGINDYGAAGLGGVWAPDLVRALDGRDPDRGLVLLAHQPRGVEDAVGAGVELQVSGHTHGGQLAPFNLVVGAVFPYLKGLYPDVRAGGQRGQVFVSRGTGYWGPPLRLGSPPEIAKIVLT